MVQKGLEGLSEEERQKIIKSKDPIYERKQIKEKAKNTYILTLDGDVDFKPEALGLLIDIMKKNDQVGATCGRIKPCGSGPVVWYQKFEYAIGHWLQKSAEDVFGCVLCSPGCFSLFRAKALMENNVMRTYASLSEEPKHYIQYDQGEDRWLCTLMLKQDYRIEYCAAAEASTYAPETIKEFFNQRRRWIPSTMANTVDLLRSYKTITKVNSNISHLFIFYQVVLLLSAILGPSTVLRAMQSAIKTVFGTSTILAYSLTYGPTVIFIFICLKFEQPFQLAIAMVLSTIYALLMMAVIVGTVVNISEEGVFTPSAVFMYVLIGIFFTAGLFHPHEFLDLFWGLLYFICIPAGYLFLSIYAICNLHDVSWGTRENQSAKREGKEDQTSCNQMQAIDEILNQLKSTNIKTPSLKDLIISTFRWNRYRAIVQSVESINNIYKNGQIQADNKQPQSKNEETHCNVNGQIQTDNKQTKTDIEQNQNLKENDFWKGLLNTHLKPFKDLDETEMTRVANSLKDLRNKVAFAYFFINGLWLVIMSAMADVKTILNIKVMINNNTITLEPLGLLFLVIFTLLLILQFCAMIRHRYGTFLHILSATNL